MKCEIWRNSMWKCYRVAPYIFVIIVDFVLWNAIKETGEKVRFDHHHAKVIQKISHQTPDGSWLCGWYENPAGQGWRYAEAILLTVEEWPLSARLHINKTNTDYMIVGKQEKRTGLKVREADIKLVEEFKYIGSWVNFMKHLNVRRAQPCCAVDRMWRMWSSHCSRKVKVWLIRPVSNLSCWLDLRHGLWAELRWKE